MTTIAATAAAVRAPGPWPALPDWSRPMSRTCPPRTAEPAPCVSTGRMRVRSVRGMLGNDGAYQRDLCAGGAPRQRDYGRVVAEAIDHRAGGHVPNQDGALPLAARSSSVLAIGRPPERAGRVLHWGIGLSSPLREQMGRLEKMKYARWPEAAWRRSTRRGPRGAHPFPWSRRAECLRQKRAWGKKNGNKLSC
jgi:hypothetical protein